MQQRKEEERNKEKRRGSKGRKEVTSHLTGNKSPAGLGHCIVAWIACSFEIITGNLSEMAL